MDVGDVVVAGQHQSRDVHVAESLRRGRVEAQHPHVVVSLLLPEGLFLHLPNELARCGIHVGEAAMRAGEPHAQIRVGCSIQVSAFERRFFVGDEGPHLLGPLVIGKPSAHEH